jgi:hypothetical protein
MQKRQQKAKGTIMATTQGKRGKKKGKTRARPQNNARRNGRGELGSIYNSNMLIPRNVLMAAELITPITTCVTVGGTTAGAVTFVDNVIKINSLADATWNTVLPGLDTYNEIYSSYRIVGCQMKLEAGSKHTANVNAAYLFTDTSTAVTTAAGVLGASVNEYGGHRLLSAVSAGKPIATMLKKVWFAKVVGNDAVEIDDDYAAATSAVADPANLIYLHLMSSTQSGNFAANGDVAFTLNVALLVKFFNRRRLLT